MTVRSSARGGLARSARYGHGLARPRARGLETGSKHQFLAMPWPDDLSPIGAQVAQRSGNLAPPFGPTASSPCEDRRGGPRDLELCFEVSDVLVGLGELVGLEGLHALSTTGVDQCLASPQSEATLYPTGARDRSSKLPRIALEHGLPPSSSRPDSKKEWLGLRGQGHLAPPNTLTSLAASRTVSPLKVPARNWVSRSCISRYWRGSRLDLVTPQSPSVPPQPCRDLAVEDS
jgi:hypothetical protein